MHALGRLCAAAPLSRAVFAVAQWLPLCLLLSTKSSGAVQVAKDISHYEVVSERD